jgi:mitochondrial fission protein ELM1
LLAPAPSNLIFDDVTIEMESINMANEAFRTRRPLTVWKKMMAKEAKGMLVLSR